jgi:hypothetical protein
MKKQKTGTNLTAHVQAVTRWRLKPDKIPALQAA